MSIVNKTLELPTEKQINGYGGAGVARKLEKNYCYLLNIQERLLKDPHNDVDFIVDENDYTLEWWDKEQSLCSITLWDSGKATVLKGKEGITLVKRKFASFDVFEKEWQSLLL